MQTSKRARLTPPNVPLPSSTNAAAAGMAATDGRKEHEQQTLREEDGSEMTNECGQTFDSGEKDDLANGSDDDSAEFHNPACAQVEEGDEEAERLSYLKNFTAEVLIDRRSCRERGLEDGLELARSTDVDSEVSFFRWLMLPSDLEVFRKLYWEKRPLLIKRPSNRKMYEGWFEKEDIEKLFETETLKYSQNVDVTKYKDGARANFSTEGAAKAAQVWKKFSKGWSVRILHPQRWSRALFLVLSAFERYWGCQAGCNAYLTPANSQGFSPHYDDIEAFILQTEGKKRWRCYKPPSIDDVLPRYSSKDYTPEEIGEPILDEILEPGDLLYMPKGTVHQAEALPECHSLHVTVSVGQRTTWADYLELAIPRALELAQEDHLILRESLPRDFTSYMGVVHSEQNDPRREEFLERVILCVDCLVKSGPWDSAVDQMAVKFLLSRLPLPAVQESGTAVNRIGKVTLGSRVRLVAPNVARSVLEDESVVLYHMLNNSRVLHNESVTMDPAPDSSLEFPLDYAPALEELLHAFPDAVLVSALSIESQICALDLVTRLVEVGVLVVVEQ